MFLLDTNVISALRQRRKAPKSLLQWADGTPSDEMYMSAVTLLELEIGTLLMERKDRAQGRVLRTWLDDTIVPMFTERILPIDASVARRCASLHVPDRKADRDALIAATALVHGMIVVTRNVADFVTTGVEIINPWD